MNSASRLEHWYVYYAVPLSDGVLAERCARAMLAQVAEATGVRGEVQERIDVRDGRRTFMEIYPRIAAPDAFGRALADAVHGAGWPEALAATRRTERFADLAAGG